MSELSNQIRAIFAQARKTQEREPRFVTPRDPVTGLTLSRPFSERFWERVQKSDGCWLWLAGKDEDGYGSIRDSAGTTRRAHRISWELANGRAVPSGLVVMHTCDNPSCVRPEHLRAGTHADNSRDRDVKGRAASGDRHWTRIRGGMHGEANGRSRVTDAQRGEIRASTEMADVLAPLYGISASSIRRIRRQR